MGNVTYYGRETYVLDGAWDDIVYITDVYTRERAELFNRSKCPKLKAESVPLDQQPETSGEKYVEKVFA